MGCHFLLLGNLPDPGTESVSPALAGGIFTTEPPGKPYLNALGRPGDPGLISESGRSPGEVNGNLLQYSCLKNPVDRGAWLATVQGVTRVGHDLVTKHHPPLQKYLIAGKTEMALQGTEIPLYR